MIRNHSEPLTCEGWKDNESAVAYRGRGGTITLDLSDSNWSSEPSSLEAKEALVVFDRDGNELRTYSPKQRRIVAFVTWIDNQTIGFYDPAVARYCLLDINNGKVRRSPFEILFCDGIPTRNK